MEWAVNPIRKWLVSPVMFMPLLQTRACRQVTAVGYLVCSWVMLIASLLVVHKLPSTATNTREKGGSFRLDLYLCILVTEVGGVFGDTILFFYISNYIVKY